MSGASDILNDIEGMRVLVIGLARSGRAAASLLAHLGARVVGTDLRESLDGLDALGEAGVELQLGGQRTELVHDADMVVLSPGVPLQAPIPVEARRLGVTCMGELELAARLLEAKGAIPLVAVTGTNGKSTTAALCAHLLEHKFSNVFLGGNIGLPFCELLLGEKDADAAVVEVSSFQLEHLTAPGVLAPGVGIWLNLTPDHLDRHGSLEAYGRAKRGLFEGQTEEDTGVFFLDDEGLLPFIGSLSCRRTGFTRHRDRLPPDGMLITDRRLQPAVAPGEEHLLLSSERLAGDHNAENAAAASLATGALGLDLQAIQAGLDSYPGLPHRLEMIRTLDDVRYVNDSKGTNVDATAKSLTSFDTPVILLAGGRGKGSGYEKLREPVSRHVKHLVLLGEEAENIARDLKGCAPVEMVADMKEAIDTARSLAEPGDVVLLSPACASFDMFTDYAHRGRVFADTVKGLEEHP